MKKFSFKLVSDAAIYVLFLAFVGFMRLLGIKRASNFCSRLFVFLGRYLTANKIIKNNLKYIYPSITDSEIQTLQDQVWDNFGRYVGEFAFMDEKYIKQNLAMIDIEGQENIQDLTDNKTPFIIFSGHFSNWDFGLFAFQTLVEDVSVVYRKINNEFIDKYVRDKRGTLGAHLIKKGKDGVRDLIKSIKGNQTMLMLVDQKMNDGIKVPFMGKPAMTSQAIAVMARQYDYPIVPALIIRQNDGRYKITFYKHFKVAKTEDKELDVYQTMVKINEIIGGWVYESPGQWFWVHQRWGKPNEMK